MIPKLKNSGKDNAYVFDATIKEQIPLFTVKILNIRNNKKRYKQII